MNAYAVNTRQDILFYSGSRDADGYKLEPDEYGAAYEVIIAKSRGHARSIITHYYNLEYTHKLTIHLLATGLDDMPVGALYPAGCKEEDWQWVALMVQAAVVWHKLSDAEEFYQWRGWLEPEMGEQ